MAKINKVCVGESLVGDGNEIAHIDLLIGPRGSAVETAFCNALTNNKDGFTTLLAVIAPNLACKPNTILFNKVTIKGAKQAVQMFGPAQYAVAKAVADSVADGIIPADEADDLFICVGVFIHWQAEDDEKIQDFNYRATKEAIERAVNGWPTAKEVTEKRNQAQHPVRRQEVSPLGPSRLSSCPGSTRASIPPAARCLSRTTEWIAGSSPAMTTVPMASASLTICRLSGGEVARLKAVRRAARRRPACRPPRALFAAARSSASRKPPGKIDARGLRPGP